MDAGLGIRLQIVDPDGDVARTIRRCVDVALADGAAEVVVIVPRSGLEPSWMHWLLHHRTAGAIRRALGPVPNASTVVLACGAQSR
jgi:hypothetical protein